MCIFKRCLHLADICIIKLRSLIANKMGSDCLDNTLPYPKQTTESYFLSVYICDHFIRTSGYDCPESTRWSLESGR